MGAGMMLLVSGELVSVPREEFCYRHNLDICIRLQVKQVRVSAYDVKAFALQCALDELVIVGVAADGDGLFR